MEHALIVSLAALALLAGTNLVALRVPIPAPVIQTFVGIALAFIPGIPTVHLNPDLVLLGILPPLIYAAAVKLPWEEFVRNMRTITILAFGLVLATVAAVAVIAHSIIPGLPWAAALALGAIVSPTDPVASTALASRIGVPQRLVAILEGEGLVNDAIALTVKTIALGAFITGEVEISAGVLRFVVIVVGEIAYGLAIGWLVASIRKRIADPSTEAIVTLITPFLAYLVPAWLGGSGVLSTVATGMYIGVQQPELVPFGTRLHLTSFWDVIVYALNGILFLLTGLQARTIWNGAASAPKHLLVYAGVIAGSAIVLRLCWTWPAAWLPRVLFPQIRTRDPMPSSRHLSFIAWSGMRGAISLAAALSIPASVNSRSVIVFITAAVIAATLLLQGTTLPWVIRMLRLDRDARAEKDETAKCEAEARILSARAALTALQGEGGRVVERIRKDYTFIINGGATEDSAREMESEAAVRRKAIAAQRRSIIDMHRRGRINDRVLRRIERDLDLHEAAIANRVSTPG